MNGSVHDPETLREVFVYLYRYWLQKYLGDLPEKLALSPSDGVLVSQSFSMYYSTEPIGETAASELLPRLRSPVLLVGPSFPQRFPAISRFDARADVAHPFDRVVAIVRERLGWLEKHRERGLARREAYETEASGKFSVWKARSATRVLFHPNSADVHGYVVIRNGPNDFFFRKSKSCKEEGQKTGSGAYKRSLHRVESKSYVNFDLLYDTGEVLLLHLTLAGAGYKAFPRQVPEPQPETV